MSLWKLHRGSPAEPAGLPRDNLELLQRSAGRLFPEPEDRAQANVSDSQDVGKAPVDEDEARGL